MVKLTVQGIAEEEINDAFEFLSVTLAEPLELQDDGYFWAKKPGRSPDLGDHASGIVRLTPILAITLTLAGAALQKAAEQVVKSLIEFYAKRRDILGPEKRCVAIYDANGRAVRKVILEIRPDEPIEVIEKLPTDTFS